MPEEPPSHDENVERDVLVAQAHAAFGFSIVGNEKDQTMLSLAHFTKAVSCIVTGHKSQY